MIKKLARLVLRQETKAMCIEHDLEIHMRIKAAQTLSTLLVLSVNWLNTVIMEYSLRKKQALPWEELIFQECMALYAKQSTNLAEYRYLFYGFMKAMRDAREVGAFTPNDYDNALRLHKAIDGFYEIE